MSDTNRPTKPPATSLDPVFERKVLFSKWALVFERFWPRFWLVFAVGAVFALLSIFDIWALLNIFTHQAVLAVLGVALLTSMVFALRVQWPTREQAIRRIERISNVAHRPASSYEDTLTAPATEEQTEEIWHAHRSRLADLIARLRVGNPQPGTHRRDPMALRLAVMVGLIMLSALAGTALPGRFASAWDFDAKTPVSTARLDAWVAPPSYTRKPPLMLSDGAKLKTPSTTAGDDKSPTVLEIPSSSALIVRASGTDHQTLKVEITTDSVEPLVLTPKKPEKKENGVTVVPTVSEIRHMMTKSGQVRILRGTEEVGQWIFAVIADEPPKISLLKKPEVTSRGSMKLAYKVTDDYGVAGAVAKFYLVPADDKNTDAKKKKPRDEVLKGPRPPLEPPPVLSLQVPRAGTKKAEAKTTLELGDHPMAGMNVLLVLEAKDVAGQIGESSKLMLMLPERQFTNPLARAVIEQRRKLVQDPRYRGQVILALGALTLEPDGFIKDTQAYLGLRAAYYRLQRDETRVGRNSVIEQLWFMALRIEDGNLSDAERRLREAQDKLAKLLKDGASEEEIKAAMEEMRQALNDYMKQLQKQAQKNGDPPPGMDEDNQVMSEKDLDKMMKDIEDAAKSGSREQAEQMLSELRDLLDNMKAGQQDTARAEQNQKMQQQMNKLGDMMNEQKKLQEETFEERRKKQAEKAGQKSGQQRSGQENQGEHGQNRGSQAGQGRPGQEKRWGGKRAQGSGKKARPKPGQQGEQQSYGRQKLGQRQKRLQKELNRMKQELSELGAGGKKGLEKAEQAMDQAQKALKEDRLGDATQQQGRALDQMREGMKELAQELMENSPQRYGEQKNQRDPLGRPQAQQGPNQGNSVRVPDEIDKQRAREILEELRRRVGEVQRPPAELEYIERLLRRF